jgi:hypothetical protein
MCENPAGRQPAACFRRLRGRGAGNVCTKRKALRLEPRCDVAVLDVNLGRETCGLVAQRLRESGKWNYCGLKPGSAVRTQLIDGCRRSRHCADIRKPGR